MLEKSDFLREKLCSHALTNLIFVKNVYIPFVP